MANTCGECGGDVFVGEVRCPHCRAVLPQRPEAPADASRGASAMGPNDLPPEGLQLIIDKQRADRDSYVYTENHYHENDRAPGGFLDPMGRSSIDDELDALGDLLRPERDRDGNVQWELKYAIWGAVIVAIAAAALYYYFSIRLGSIPKFSSVGAR